MPLSLVIVLICEGLLIVFSIYLVWSWISRTPFYPSNLNRLNKIVNDNSLKLPANFKFIDIGSGDGRIVAWAAKKGGRAEGIEFNPFLSLFSRLLLLIRGLSFRTRIYNKNFNNHNFSSYNVAYLYVFPEHMEQIKNKLFSELPKGAIVITNTFKFESIDFDEKHDRFYIYYVK